MRKFGNLFSNLLAVFLFVSVMARNVTNLQAGQNIWVNANAVVSGDGSFSKPFKTIQEAATIAVPGTVIHVLPGIYRERVMPEHSGRSGHPIIYQSEVLHGAVVTGADVWRPQWRREGGEIYSGELKNSLFTDNGYVDGGNPFRIPYYWQKKKHYLPPYPFTNVAWTLGQVFEAGWPLMETSTPQELKATDHSWWFDPVTSRIEINFGGQNPRNHLIEITTRRGVFRPRRKGLGYIEVRGFVFEDCANQFPGDFWKRPENAQSGMVGTRGGNHWVIADNIIRYAKSIGLTFGTSGGRGTFDNELPAQPDPPRDLVGYDQVVGNVFAFNGDTGAMGCHTHDVYICSNLFYGNNRLLNTSYETGAIKTHFAYGLRIEHNWFINNDCMGVWLDNTWKNCLVARNIFLGNRGRNVFFEMDDNTAGTASLVFCNLFLLGRPALEPASRLPPPLWQPWAVGIYGHDASGIHIVRNLFAGEGYGLYFRKITPRKGGAADLVATDNLFVGDLQTAVCLPIENPPLVEGNVLNANIYPAASRQPFVATGWSLSNGGADRQSVERIWKLAGGSAGGASRFGNPARPPDGFHLSFGQWQTVMGFDRQSREIQIDYTFNRHTWALSLDVPREALEVKPSPETKEETDFFGHPFSSSGIVGPFANCGAGTYRIQLPRPNLQDALPPSARRNLTARSLIDLQLHNGG